MVVFVLFSMSANLVRNSLVKDVSSGVVGIGFLKANVLVSEYLVRVSRVSATFVDILVVDWIDFYRDRLLR